MPLVANAVPVLHEHRRPGRRASARFFALAAGGRSVVAPVAELQGELWANLDDHDRRVRRRRAAVPAGDDQRRPGGARDGDRDVPDPAVLRERGRFFARPPAGRRGAAQVRADARERVRRRARRRCARAAALNRRAERCTSATCRPSPQDPLVPIGFKDLTQTVEALDPTVEPPRAARRRSATTSRCSSATPRACSSDGDQNGTWLRVHAIRSASRRTGAERRGRPASARRRTAAATRRRSTRTSCTRTRTRTPPRRARRASARPATRPTPRASR